LDRSPPQLESLDGDSASYEYAQVLAQWRRPTEALRWLKKTERLGDPAIIGLKVDPLPIAVARYCVHFSSIRSASSVAI
jgi:hypothetical protein